VKAFFALNKADQEALSKLELQELPRSLAVFRCADGSTGYEIFPTPRRLAKPFQVAAGRLDGMTRRLDSQTQKRASSRTDDGSAHLVGIVSEALAHPDDDWSDEWLASLDALIAWLQEVPSPTRSSKPRDDRSAALLLAVRAVVLQEHPAGPVEALLAKRVPKFVLFNDQNRLLPTSNEMSSDQLRATPPNALRDLLRIADVDINSLWHHTTQGDISARETLLERGNERLLSFFNQTWNQAKITVRLDTNASLLEVLVKELHEGGHVTNIDERSDGLRVFVALVAFLASGGWAVPPVLLIDEAETHLHFDAQADLVSVLLRSLDAEQVLYTTHSPGCLPSDLGTGIRLVTRDPGDPGASIIKNNFWAGEEPGYAPLLYAMGAGAAAFSVCRRAVVGEGPTEMVLLPSLLRLATDQEDLNYQVAPGLSNARAFGMRVEEVAAKVVYLADGDAGGNALVTHLRDLGVNKERVFSLPPGTAVEDLVMVDDYLKAVNDLLAEMGETPRFTRPDIVPGIPIAKCFCDWAKRTGTRTPSKVEVAYRLLAADPIRLQPASTRFLRALHSNIRKAFGDEY
jgi:predicted ATP-dependent endonuclease of OLD family